MANAVVYVGRISPRTSKRELEEKFESFGEITRCDLKTNYAFIEYRESKSADDACRALDNTELGGVRILVEPSRRGEGRCYACGRDGHWARECRESRGGGGRPGGGGGGRGGDRGGDRGGGREPGRQACYTCGEIGHFARECRNSSRRGSNRGGFTDRFHPYRRAQRRYSSPRRGDSRTPSRSPSPRGRRSPLSGSDSGSSRSPRRSPIRRRRSRSYDSLSPRGRERDRDSRSPKRDASPIPKKGSPRDSPKPIKADEGGVKDVVENKEQNN